MAKRFQTVVKRARFAVPGFSAEQMIEIGNDVISSIKGRLAQGLDVYDQPAPPLSMNYRERYDKNHRLISMGSDRGYRAFKQHRTGRSVRDWNLTGFTLRHLKVLTAQTNKCVIGFLPGVYPMRSAKRPVTVAEIVAMNQRRSRQFGISPRDKQNLAAAILRQKSPVTTTRAA